MSADIFFEVSFANILLRAVYYGPHIKKVMKDVQIQETDNLKL